MDNEQIKLTEFAGGAGCGCKIPPKILDEILKTNIVMPDTDKLLVGNNSKDDAAVYDLGNGTALISTTDFFTPIVNDATDFGKTAAANSISDVYAMGGKPILAIAILGWPVDKLPAELAQKIIEGAKIICSEAGIPLAGGHSINSQEPIFGLAVNGIVAIKNLKKNNTATVGDYLFLTKSIGTGVLAAAQKRNILKEEHLAPLIEQMTCLNKIGEQLGNIDGVTAMTDITGFGLLGHLIEMTEGSGLSATIQYHKIQMMAGAKEYAAQRIFPDATTRNWNAYSEKVKFEKGVNVMEAFTLLPDPQTNGGLLFSVKEDSMEEALLLLNKSGLSKFLDPIGRMISRSDKTIIVTA